MRASPCLSIARRAFAHGQGRPPSWWRLLALLILTVLPLRAEVSKEYQVKAAFLYNFTKFVEWPPQRFADETSPIIIGLLGRNPFGDELARIVQGRTVSGRAILVKLVQTTEEMSKVHLLFVPAGEESRVMAAAWQNAGTVSVGESDLFATLGGVITFALEGDKVRFAINLEPIERGGPKMSAQLLKLATRVRRKS